MQIPVRSSDHELLIVLSVGVRLVCVHVRSHRVTERQELKIVNNKNNHDLEVFQRRKKGGGQRFRTTKKCFTLSLK